jgi:hypothetical protein
MDPSRLFGKHVWCKAAIYSSSFKSAGAPMGRSNVIVMVKNDRVEGGRVPPHANWEASRHQFVRCSTLFNHTWHFIKLFIGQFVRVKSVQAGIWGPRPKSLMPISILRGSSPRDQQCLVARCLETIADHHDSVYPHKLHYRNKHANINHQYKHRCHAIIIISS